MGLKKTLFVILERNIKLVIDKNKMKKYTNGFTLIELLVVIVIIGILAGIGISSFKQYKIKATVAALSARIVQEKKFFLTECIGNGKELKNCPVSYASSHVPNPVNGSFRYGALPAYCEEFCSAKSNSANSYRIPTKEEAIWLAKEGRDVCNASWHYEDNSAQLFVKGFPMYLSRSGCSIVDEPRPRFITWQGDVSRTEEVSRSDCACISYPVIK